MLRREAIPRKTYFLKGEIKTNIFSTRKHLGILINTKLGLFIK